MKAIVLSLFVALLSFSSLQAKKYKFDQEEFENYLLASEDVTYFYDLSKTGEYNPFTGQIMMEGEKNLTTAAIIAFATSIAGNSVAITIFWLGSAFSGGIGLFVCWPILIAPMIPWHRIAYLGTGGNGFKVSALYCLTLNWCGWLGIVDGIMLLAKPEGNYVDNPKYLMWAK